VFYHLPGYSEGRTSGNKDYAQLTIAPSGRTSPNQQMRPETRSPRRAGTRGAFSLAMCIVGIGIELSRRAKQHAANSPTSSKTAHPIRGAEESRTDLHGTGERASLMA
jgi:hypothetical protein